MMRAKIIAQVIVLTAALAIYTLVSYTALDLEIPSFSGAATLVICLYLMGVIFFILAHGLANIFRKFGPTYALAMILYFGIMVLCGMMGIQTDQLPRIPSEDRRPSSHVLRKQRLYRSVAGRKLQLYAPDTILFIHGSHKRNPSSVCEL